MLLKTIPHINSDVKCVYISQKSFTECSAMLLFSHILIMRVQPGTLISMKKLKRKYK